MKPQSTTYLGTNVSDIEKKLLVLQLKGLMDFHVERAKLDGITTEIQEITGALLDLIFDTMKKLKEDEI